MGAPSRRPAFARRRAAEQRTIRRGFGCYLTGPARAWVSTSLPQHFPRPSQADDLVLRSAGLRLLSVVIGGTSLFGAIGTVVGTLLIGVLLNGLVLNNVSSYVQQVIIGVIIVLAVAFDTFAKSRRRRA